MDRSTYNDRISQSGKMISEEKKQSGHYRNVIIFGY